MRQYVPEKAFVAKGMDSWYRSCGPSASSRSDRTVGLSIAHWGCTGPGAISSHPGRKAAGNKSLAPGAGIVPVLLICRPQSGYVLCRKSKQNKMEGFDFKAVQRSAAVVAKSRLFGLIFQGVCLHCCRMASAQSCEITLLHVA
jgi:hypothetical protein